MPARVDTLKQLITVPMEQDFLSGIAFLDTIESASMPGLSTVILTFEPETNLLDAHQAVAERLTQAVGVAGHPETAKPPQTLQPPSSTNVTLWGQRYGTPHRQLTAPGSVNR